MLTQHSTLPEVNDTLRQAGLPTYMGGGLQLYLATGICTGGFLTALLKGDPSAAWYADDTNAALIGTWRRFLSSHLPPESYGSQARFDQWQDDRRAERAKAEQLLDDVTESERDADPL